jgi:hypothetical protein
MSPFPKSFLEKEIKIVEAKITELENSFAYQKKMELLDKTETSKLEARLVTERKYLASLIYSLNQ